MAFIGWQRGSAGSGCSFGGVVLIALAAAVGVGLSPDGRRPGVANLPVAGAILAMRRARRPRLSAAQGAEPLPAARSWTRSRASANISASPRKTGSTRSIRRRRRRSCSSDSCPTRSRSIARTPGRRNSPACWRRPARPLPPGLVCRQPRLVERSGVVRRPSRRRPLVDHLVVIDGAGLQRRWRRRQQRRRLLRRRRGRRRRRWLVTGVRFA